MLSSWAGVRGSERLFGTAASERSGRRMGFGFHVGGAVHLRRTVGRSAQSGDAHHDNTSECSSARCQSNSKYSREPRLFVDHPAFSQGWSYAFFVCLRYRSDSASWKRADFTELEPSTHRLHTSLPADRFCRAAANRWHDRRLGLGQGIWPSSHFCGVMDGWASRTGNIGRDFVSQRPAAGCQ